MEDLRVRIELQHNVGDRDLQGAFVFGDSAPHPGDGAQLDVGGEGERRFGNWSNSWWAPLGEVTVSKLVEPEDAGDAAGAVVDGEQEELPRFEIQSHDDSDRLGPR